MPGPLLIPMLKVKSIHSAVEFYTTKLGFTLDDKSVGSHNFAEVFLGNKWRDSTAHIMMQIEQTGAPVTSVELLICLSEDGKGKEVVDEWHDKLVKRGAEASEKPEDKPWNCRQMSFLDPDGNKISFYYWMGGK